MVEAFDSVKGAWEGKRCQPINPTQKKYKDPKQELAECLLIAFVPR